MRTERFVVQHCPITKSVFPWSSHDWNHCINTSEFRKLRSYIYDLWTNCHTQKGWEALMHFVYNVHWMHWLSSIRKRSFTICHKVSLLWHFNWLTTNQILLRDSGQSQTIKLVVYLLWNATKLQSVLFLCVVYFLIDWS